MRNKRVQYNRLPVPKLIEKTQHLKRILMQMKARTSHAENNISSHHHNSDSSHSQLNIQ